MESLLPIIKSFLLFVAGVDYTGLILVIGIITFAVIFYRMNRSQSSKFFFDELFLDSNGHASTSKLAHVTALFVSTWAFVHLTLKGMLSEWFFMAYMAIWVMQRSYTKWIDMQKDMPKETKVEEVKPK